VEKTAETGRDGELREMSERMTKKEKLEFYHIQEQIYLKKKKKWALAVSLYVVMLFLVIMVLPFYGIAVIGYGLLILEIWTTLKRKFNPEEW
jgi:hypothetical protein